MEDDHYQPHCHPKAPIVLIVPNILVSQIETLNCDICMFFFCDFHVFNSGNDRGVHFRQETTRTFIFYL